MQLFKLYCQVLHHSVYTQIFCFFIHTFYITGDFLQSYLEKSDTHTGACMDIIITHSVSSPYTIYTVCTSMSESLHICIDVLCIYHLTHYITHTCQYRTSLYYSDYFLHIFAQVHQHLLKNVERPIKEVVDKMESTLLTLDVENRLTSSVI